MNPTQQNIIRRDRYENKQTDSREITKYIILDGDM